MKRIFASAVFASMLIAGHANSDPKPTFANTSAVTNSLISHVMSNHAADTRFYAVEYHNSDVRGIYADMSIAPVSMPSNTVDPKPSGLPSGWILLQWKVLKQTGETSQISITGSIHRSVDVNDGESNAYTSAYKAAIVEVEMLDPQFSTRMVASQCIGLFVGDGFRAVDEQPLAYFELLTRDSDTGEIALQACAVDNIPS